MLFRGWVGQSQTRSAAACRDAERRAAWHRLALLIQRVGSGVPTSTFESCPPAAGASGIGASLPLPELLLLHAGRDEESQQTGWELRASPPHWGLGPLGSRGRVIGSPKYRFAVTFLLPLPKINLLPLFHKKKKLLPPVCFETLAAQRPSSSMADPRMDAAGRCPTYLPRV